MTLVAALAVGGMIGWARGGRLNNLATAGFRWVAIIWIAGGLQLGVVLLPTSIRLHVGTAAVVVSYALLAVWATVALWRSPRRLRLPLALAAAGLAANMAVLLANGGMPVSRAAAQRSGLPASIDVRRGSLYKHVPATRSTTLARLGDVIPMPRWWPDERVISVGDILLLVGLASIVATGMVSAPDARPVL